MTSGMDYLVSSVSQLVMQRLEEAGMQKRAGDIFTGDLAAASFGWVGLNRAVRQKEQVLEINPVIGVRHQRIEKLLAALLEEKFHRYAPPTISVHLGYLMPERRYVPWFFKADTDNVPEALRLVTKIVQHGFPFIETNSALPELIRTMEAGVGVPSELTYRLPIAYALENDSPKAISYLDDQVLVLGDAENAYAKRYRKFAARLVKHIQSHDIQDG